MNEVTFNLRALAQKRVGKPRSAFSLIELLVSIAVVAILSAIVVSVVGQIRRTSDKVTCASNLRQIGTAISLYTNDHDGTLPGPAYAAFGVYYFRPTSQDKLLLFYVGDYLGMGEAPSYSDRKICDTAVCPAYESIVPRSEWTVSSTTYECQWAVSNLTSGTQRLSPWGKVTDSSVTDAPMLLSTLNSLVDVGTLWAIRDKNVSVALADHGLVHRNFRNTLFFDGHVESVPAE